MWNIIEFEEVTSTNTLANELLARGEAKHGDVIVARHQTSGRGRAAGRVWNDEPDASLLMSVVLTTLPEPVHLLQYRVALAVLHALRSLAKEQNAAPTLRLKWPNDILIAEKKVCGILLEAQWNGAAMRSAIVGIGVNVRQRKFPKELESIATSLFINGIDLFVEDVRKQVLTSLEADLSVARVPNVLVPLEEELHWMSAIPSLEVTEGDQQRTDLHFEGIDEAGALRLRDSAGKLLIVRNGSLSWNKQNG